MNEPVCIGDNDNMPASGWFTSMLFWRKAIECVCHLLNVEPGDNDLSASCKINGKELVGEKVPVGASVYFKPRGASAVDQSQLWPQSNSWCFRWLQHGAGHH